MKLAYLAFTEQGLNLANELGSKLGGEVSRCGKNLSLAQWTKGNFTECDGLIFVGALGIAVRAIAPHINRKDEDPAVVVVDELGRFAISLLSGHLGGANELATKVADIIGGQAVITTATDINHRFAVDIWAKNIDAKVEEVARIKLVSSKILDGEKIKIYSPWEILGQVPDDILPSSRLESDVCLDVKIYDEDGDSTLHLVPRIGILGVGCRKNISMSQIEDAFEQFIKIKGICPSSISQVVSIDLKKDEPALKNFCQDNGWEFTTYTAEELRAVEGSFNESEFVKSIAGVGSVCERSVACAGARLIEEKFVHSGVTLAFGVREYRPMWPSEE